VLPTGIPGAVANATDEWPVALNRPVNFVLKHCYLIAKPSCERVAAVMHHTTLSDIRFVFFCVSCVLCLPCISWMRRFQLLCYITPLNSFFLSFFPCYYTLYDLIDSFCILLLVLTLII